jgi:glucokinase
MILAGDVGGTKSTFSLFNQAGTVLQVACRISVPTRSAKSFSELLDRVRAEASGQNHDLKKLKSVAFGVAGVLDNDRIVSKNLPWSVEKKTIAEAVHLPETNVVLLNDLAAAAASITHLNDRDLLPLNAATAQPHAPKALIAAGTGLGESILFWNGQRYQISPSEAGMSDFAPANDVQHRLLQGLRQRMERVCTEEIVSGRGFRAIHEILFPDSSHDFFNESGSDVPAAITQQGLTGACDACEETIRIWIEAYGSEAGNMALRVLPFGGVYVAGGIALKILPTLKEGGFVPAFSDKIKLKSQLEKIPIYVVLNEDAPVIGAAYEALAISSS